MKTRTIDLRCTFSAMKAEVDLISAGTTELITFMCITDLDEGMSVTNDIEAVLAVLVAEGELAPGMRVVYRDTEAMWDEVVIDERCRFVRFAPLRVPSSDLAITLAVSRTGAQ